jgi:hypothetical protein
MTSLPVPGPVNRVRTAKTITRWYPRHEIVDTRAERNEKSREACVFTFGPSFGPTASTKPAVSPLAPSSVYTQGRGPLYVSLESFPPLVMSTLLSPSAIVHQTFVSVARMSTGRELHAD